jgi:hypothetical protein
MWTISALKLYLVMHYFAGLLISNLETLLSTAVAIMQVRKKEQRRASTLSMPEVVHLVWELLLS